MRYFEQVQFNMNYYWEKDEVLSKLDTKMTSAFSSVYLSLSRKIEYAGCRVRHYQSCC